MMVNASSWKGVNSLLDSYLEVRSDDTVIIAYTSETYEYAAWLYVALDMRGIIAQRVWMLPIHDVEFANRFSNSLPHPDHLPGRLIIITLEFDTLSHGQVIRSALCKFDVNRTMVYRVISACESLFSDALKIAPMELSARNARILEFCTGGKKMQVTTPGGTDLRITTDSSKYKWISNRGIWRPGKFVVLPPGEVATFPAAIEGIFVADFAFNINMITDIDARLNNHPVTVWIDNNRVVRYECSDKAISLFLDKCFQTPYADIVGELGFGTNIGIQTPIPLNSHINERHPGVHLGFGQSNQSPEVVEYNCNIHLDLISKGGMIWVDDNPISLDIENIIPSSLPHPTYTYDEDAHSGKLLDDSDIDDCCGIFTNEGMKLFSSKPDSSSFIAF